MREIHHHPRRTLAALALGTAALVIAAAPAVTPDARGQSAAPAPEFTAPLDISNPFLPFVPGTVKVYAGREEGRAVTVVETHRPDVRAFEWNGTQVECRVVEELEFKAGALVARTRSFFAQSNDGAVWAFGEVEDADPNDDPPDEPKEPNGWIVGQRGPGDPENTVEGAEPAMAMPASPSVGAEWMTVDVPGLAKSCRVQSANATVRVTGARHSGCLRVRESDLVEGESEMTWYAPGVGLVEVRERRDRLTLTASTVRRGH